MPPSLIIKVKVKYVLYVTLYIADNTFYTRDMVCKYKVSCRICGKKDKGDHS